MPVTVPKHAQPGMMRVSQFDLGRGLGGDGNTAYADALLNDVVKAEAVSNCQI